MAQDKTSSDTITEIPNSEATNLCRAIGVRCIQLQNNIGVTAEFLNWGARLTKLWVPDRDGNLRNILLAYPKANDYLEDPFYLGALVGPYANRIADGKINARGVDIRLPLNGNGEHLHSEDAGFDRQFWQVEAQDALSVRFVLSEPDGFGGYPGNRMFIAEFRLAEKEARLDLTVWAESDQLTPYGVSQHSYFNLDGDEPSGVISSGAEPEPSLKSHYFRIPATHYLPVNECQIPLAGRSAVDSTPFDLQALTHYLTLMKPEVDDGFQAQAVNGFDHCWCFDREIYSADDMVLNGEALSETSGIRMKIFSNQPGMQFYTGQWLSRFTGRQGDKLGFTPMQGFCMEPQQFPNGPNREDAPEAWLKPSSVTVSKMRWAFDAL